MRPIERLLRKPIRRARRGRQRRRLVKDTIGKRRAHERWVAEIRARVEDDR